MNPAISAEDSHLLEAIRTSPQEHQKKMKDARPRNFPTVAASLALAVALTCLLVGFWLNLRGEVRVQALAGASPVTFSGKWIPLKPIYHPGETAYFRFKRTANFTDEYLYLVSIMAIEDGGSGVNYPGGLGVRKLLAEDRGTTEAYATRRIPDDVAPGKKYHLVGLILCQTEHRTQPVGIDSEYFEIVSWNSEQERSVAAKRREAEKPSDLPVEGDSSKTSLSELLTHDH